jgi:hypothetical protein
LPQCYCPRSSIDGSTDGIEKCENDADEEEDDEDEASESDFEDDETLAPNAEKNGYDADVDDGDNAASEEYGEVLEIIDSTGNVEVVNLAGILTDDDSRPDQPGDHRRLKGIILSPTRELAKQIWKEANAAAKYTDVKVR